ncbi:MAG: helix-turn-helix transcriptional regulator [Myxococcaceae bacterium]|nr:helix-turn-helix transcriptional regulator [Myxococcaceae bacterium]
MPLSPFSTEAGLLCVLRAGPNYGLGIARALKRAGASVLPGALYPALKSLESKGYVVAAPSSDEQRRFFRLTSLGRTKARSLARTYRAIGGRE